MDSGGSVKGVVKKIKNFLIPERPVVEVPEFPPKVLIEPTNACNLRCRMCPAYGEEVVRKREKGFISHDLWRGIIDEIGSWPSPVNLDIHGAGEPLLHPEFLDILAYAKSKHNITAGFLSNATLLDEEKARRVVETGVDWVYFSVDGGEKEVFEYYRKGASLDQVEENIRYLLSIRKNGRPSVSFNMVRHEEADIDRFIDKWKGKVDLLVISLKRPVKREENRRLRLLKPCPLIYEQLVIGWPGITGLCCEDYWGDYITGEFPAMSLHQIWHGKALQRARKLHEKGRAEEIFLCRTCDAIMFHQYRDTMPEPGTMVREELPELVPDFVRLVEEQSG